MIVADYLLWLIVGVVTSRSEFTVCPASAFLFIRLI